MRKKRSTLMRRRTTAIVAAAIAIVILSIATAVILDYVRTTTVIDPSDKSTYYIRYRDGELALYDSDKKTKMPNDNPYGFYELRSGNLVEIDQDTGVYKLMLVDETVDSETYEGYNYSLMMFPHIEEDNIRRIDVVNDSGSFTFYRYDLDKKQPSDSAGFKIKGSENVDYDQVMFAQLHVNAGYTIVEMKVDDPIKDKSGNYSEYGLVPETRPLFDKTTGEPVIDETTGEQKTYEYKPAYYVLTDTDGKQYKVIIGDMLITGTGYYVQYVDIGEAGEEIKRDAVYVLPIDIESTMLVPIENFVTPKLTYPMSLNDYFDVENFFIYKLDASAEDRYGDPIIGFTYIDLADREFHIDASRPYVFTEGTDFGDGYFPSDSNINACLQALHSPSFEGVVKLDPTDADRCKYGFLEEVNGTYTLKAEYIVRYNFDIRDEDGEIVDTVHNEIFFSAADEVTGNRYAYTNLYLTDSNGEPIRDDDSDSWGSLGIIVEVKSHTVEFLKWDTLDWITTQYFNLNIAFCKEITLQAGDYYAQFILDNSKSGMTEGSNIKSDKISISATEKIGSTIRETTTFSEMKFEDVDGYIWTVGALSIRMHDSKGQEYRIEGGRYDHNLLDEQTLVLDGYITCKDGRKVYISANEVRIEPLEGKAVTYSRCDTSLFRKFYQTLLYSNIVNSYKLTEDEKNKIENDESEKLLEMTVVDSEGVKTKYVFYYLSPRKAYIAINDEGGFYVMSNRVKKIISDAQRFFNNEMIEPTDKN